MDAVTFKIHLSHEYAVLPKKAHPNDAGFDLCSVTPLEIAPGERVVAGTGVHVEMAPGWEAQVRPRSGNAAKLGLTIVNTPGTIDCDYTGEIMVILLNTSKEHVSLPLNAKIAQLIFNRVPHVTLEVTDKKPESATRGDKRFGSSGITHTV